MITNGGYTYDAQSRLISVETVGGASRPDAIRAEFFYDPRNRCILRKYYTRGSQSQWVLNSTDSRALTYDSAWNLLTERTLDGKQVGEYIHGQRTDEILRAELAQLPLKPSTSTATVYPLADGLGSTVALTDDKGKVTERYRYTAYGTPTVLTAGYLPTSNSDLLKTYRFLFTGREWLRSMGLNDHRNRYYSPALGRWLTTDPIKFMGRDINIYRYVFNHAVGLADPRGLEIKTQGFYDELGWVQITASYTCEGISIIGTEFTTWEAVIGVGWEFRMFAEKRSSTLKADLDSVCGCSPDGRRMFTSSWELKFDYLVEKRALVGIGYGEFTIGMPFTPWLDHVPSTSKILNFGPICCK